MNRVINYVLVFVVGFALCAGLYNTMPNRLAFGGNAPAAALGAGPNSLAGMAPSAVNGPPPAPPAGSTIYAVARAEPSVVNIDITGKPVARPSQEDPFGMGGGFESPDQQVVPQGQASGVIISKDGYILTNNHVAGDASSLRVTLRDGRRFSARVVGLDPRSDLAVIKIDADNLPAATIGNSKNVQVGQSVIAVGNPLGIGTTATHGIVSAIRSPFQIKDHIFPEIIQTDAAINPGNSGGALADLNGAIIGINTAIASTSGGSIGIGFAIPIDMAMQHAGQLIKDKSVAYPWLGVMYQPQMPDQPLPVKGVVVRGVVPNSPAAEAGVHSGEVITKIDEHAIDEPERVNYLVQQHVPGDKVTLELWKNGATRTVNVTLGKMPSNLQAPQPSPDAEP